MSGCLPIFTDLIFLGCLLAYINLLVFPTGYSITHITLFYFIVNQLLELKFYFNFEILFNVVVKNVYVESDLWFDLDGSKWKIT
jgi:hypothetical protein